jgi:hypothetical protein
VLVILTDGYVNDMSQTLELIVDLSVLPASLIIAGIGKEDFSQMDVLNAETLTDEKGRLAKRSVVRFVKY